jgi:hypothetical protein
MNILIGNDRIFMSLYHLYQEKYISYESYLISIKIAECTNEESNKANAFIQIILMALD